MAKATVYLTVEPVWSHYAPDCLNSIKVTKTTKAKPDKASGPVVKLTLDIPDAAFKPLSPEVTIEVPEQLLDFSPTVTVEFPDE